MKRIVLLIFLFSLIISTSASLAQQLGSANYTSESECFTIRPDGSMIVRCTGTGPNKAIALQQARKSALYDVIFKGFIGKGSNCTCKPMLTSVSVYENNKYYFDDFFSSKTVCKRYAVRYRPQKINGNNIVYLSNGVKVYVVYKVYVNRLSKKLSLDGIKNNN